MNRNLRYSKRFLPKYPKAPHYVPADPRGTQKCPDSRSLFRRRRGSPFHILLMIFVMLPFFVYPVVAQHFPSTSGIYWIRKNVDVELLVLVRIIHLTKAMLLHEWERDANNIKAYTRLSRYIRLMSGAQVLLHHAMNNKAGCTSCHLPSAQCR